MHTAALLAAYELTLDRARRYALAVTGDPEDGADALHDALIRLLNRPARPGDNPGGLLWATTRNLVLDIRRYRDRRRYASLPAHWLGAPPPRGERVAPLPAALVERETPEAVVLQADERARVRAVVQRLSEAQRAALVAHYWEGQRLHGNPRLKSATFRGRREFRRLWREEAA